MNQKKVIHLHVYIQDGRAAGLDAFISFSVNLGHYVSRCHASFMEFSPTSKGVCINS